MSAPSITRNLLAIHELKLETGKVYIRLSHVDNQAGTCTGLSSLKRLGAFLRSISTPPGWYVSPSQGYPRIKFAGTHYTTVRREALMR